MDLDIATAVRIMGESSITKANTLLDKMEDMQDKWDRHCMGQSPFEDDDEFFECFRYEVNAYNVIYREMKPLFA
tara:strand:- start:162 stop:383 length:222 start_codon:yes stop_codon:yes gene_type:complete